ncbi:MAG: ATP-binding protein [Candidatus Parabeggiatoa sp.]|nr:ATP-binding protein [Candidatus Parabeggiatoa sp.]
MLVEFSVSNYRSIGDEQILSLVPSSSQEYLNNILEQGTYKALNAIGIYGNNASGKSNLLNAIELLDKLLYLSARSNSTTQLPYQPFLLREGYDFKPTQLEITFILDENRYRFGLEYNKNEIKREWLYCKKASLMEAMLFEREADIIEVSSEYQGSPELINAAIEATRDNALFISTCDMLNIAGAKSLFKWFDKLISINGIETEREEITTVHLWENQEYRQKIKEYLRFLNLDIHDLDILIQDIDVSKRQNLLSPLDKKRRNQLIKAFQNIQGFQTMTVHQAYNEQGNPLNQKRWDLDEHESEGTKKAFHLSGPVIRTLSKGGVLVIDEIEAKMHPMMTINSINLFLNKATNPYGAQIIFATHDTNLLTYCPLRRDQINFVEKNNWEATELYALSDLSYFDETSKRSDLNKEKSYFEGRYGAIPTLGSLREKVEKWYG